MTTPDLFMLVFLAAILAAMAVIPVLLREPITRRHVSPRLPSGMHLITPAARLYIAPAPPITGRHRLDVTGEHAVVIPGHRRSIEDRGPESNVIPFDEFWAEFHGGPQIVTPAAS